MFITFERLKMIKFSQIDSAFFMVFIISLELIYFEVTVDIFKNILSIILEVDGENLKFKKSISNYCTYISTL